MRSSSIGPGLTPDFLTSGLHAGVLLTLFGRGRSPLQSIFNTLGHPVEQTALRPAFWPDDIGPNSLISEEYRIPPTVILLRPDSKAFNDAARCVGSTPLQPTHALPKDVSAGNSLGRKEVGGLACSFKTISANSAASRAACAPRASARESGLAASSYVGVRTVVDRRDLLRPGPWGAEFFPRPSRAFLSSPSRGSPPNAGRRRLTTTNFRCCCCSILPARKPLPPLPPCWQPAADRYRPGLCLGQPRPKGWETKDSCLDGRDSGFKAELLSAGTPLGGASGVKKDRDISGAPGRRLGCSTKTAFGRG